MVRSKEERFRADATMVEWLGLLNELRPGYQQFGNAVVREEESKVARLAAWAHDIGLPIYPSFRFDLRTQRSAFREACRRITANADWQLAVRISRHRTGEVLVRALGMSAEQARQAVKDLPEDAALNAILAPYKQPARSGTLWIAGGQAVMEFTFGPHTLISKGRGDAAELFWCCYGGLCHRVRYSTQDERTRAILHSTFQDTTRMVFGCRVDHATEWGQSIYAEFHWHSDVGYRFIECTKSPVWTCERSSGLLLCPNLS